jgi:hypothetical protein
MNFENVKIGDKVFYLKGNAKEETVVDKYSVGDRHFIIAD